MRRVVTLDVTVKIVEPTHTAVVAAMTMCAEFPKTWGPSRKATGTRWPGPRLERSTAVPTRPRDQFDVDVFWSLEVL
jgi:hypothetical protein